MTGSCRNRLPGAGHASQEREAEANLREFHFFLDLDCTEFGRTPNKRVGHHSAVIPHDRQTYCDSTHADNLRFWFDRTNCKY